MTANFEVTGLVTYDRTSGKTYSIELKATPGQPVAGQLSIPSMVEPVYVKGQFVAVTVAEISTPAAAS